MGNQKKVFKPYSSKNKILGMWGEIKECLDQEITRKKIWEACKKRGYVECSYSFFMKVVQKQKNNAVSQGGAGVTHQKRLIEYFPNERYEPYSKKTKVLRVWDKIEALLNKDMSVKAVHKECKKKGYIDSNYSHFVWVVREKRSKLQPQTRKGPTNKRRLRINSSMSRALQQSDEISEYLDQGKSVKEIHRICTEKGYVHCGYLYFFKIIQIIRQERKKVVSVKRVGVGRGVTQTSNILKKWDEINECLEKGVKRKEIWKACQKRGYFECCYSLFRRVVHRQREKAVALGGVRVGEGIAHAHQKRLIEDFSNDECYSKKVNILRVWDEINECLEKGISRKKIWEVCQKRRYFECSYEFFMQVVTQRQGDKAVALGGAGVTHQKRLIEYLPIEYLPDECYPTKTKISRVWGEIEALLNKGMSLKAVHKACIEAGYFDADYFHFVQMVRQKRDKLQPQTRKGPTNKRRLHINSSKSRALQQSDEITAWLDQGMTLREIHGICKKKGYVHCGYRYFLNIIQIIRQEREKAASLGAVRVGDGIAHADQKGKELPVSGKMSMGKEGSGVLKSAPKHQSEQFA